MRNKIAKRIRKGMKPEQTRQDYQAFKKVYKGLPQAVKNKINQKQQRGLK